MTKIFESPDKGKTVYAREFGESEKTLYMEDGVRVEPTEPVEPKVWTEDGND
jgi:hypothetical protein